MSGAGTRGTVDDDGLADEVRAAAPGHERVVAATVDARGVRTVALGLDRSADVEIGSVSKGLTGLLYVDACERGEVGPSTRLGDVLPLDGAPAGDVTLGALATHRSGLPRLPAAAQPWRRTFRLWRHGTNPYGETLEELLGQAREVRLGRPRPLYSNLGFELLGHAVAAAAGTTYADLLRGRLVEPLGLGTMYVPGDATELLPGAVIGTDGRARRPREAWTGEGIGPAGGVRATVDALAGLVSALVDRSAPGAAALDPVADFARGVRIGAGWITLASRGREVTWHNGGTGGFRAWLGLDRAARTGAVVVTARSRSVDRAGFRLLAGLEAPSS